LAVDIAWQKNIHSDGTLDASAFEEAGAKSLTHGKSSPMNCFQTAMRSAFLVLLLAAPAAAANDRGAIAEGVKKFPRNAHGDYQLGGAYPPPRDVNLVVRDSKEKPLTGAFNICYVNGFQSQPDEAWPLELLVHDGQGKLLADPNWPDEYLLNISSEDRRKAIFDRLNRSIAACAKSGFDAVEFDNLDSFTRSHAALTRQDAVDFAVLLVAAAHKMGLAAGQKNTPQLGAAEKKRVGFDFAVAEECQRYNECWLYEKYYGRQVIDIEYVGDLGGPVAAICADPSIPAITIIRDRPLGPRTAAGYFYHHC